MFKNSLDNKRYYTLNCYYKRVFGCKVFKVSLNPGFTCPNKDGKVGTGGCIYCSPSGSGDFAGNTNDDLMTQFNKVKEVMLHKWPNGKYIAYFQANSNTYGDLDKLKSTYEQFLNVPGVIGISIATRPDCFTNELYDYLEDLNKKTFLTIELGLQSSNDKTLKYINRGHDLKCFDNCFKELQKRNIKVIVHIINGLPNETQEDMLNTVKYLNSLHIYGIKIHMLHIIKNTKLYSIYKEKPFHVLTEEEYIDTVIKQLELLDEDVIICRITGDPVKEDIVEPKWLVKKFIVLNNIDKEMVKRDTYQGKYAKKKEET
ncbi:MAG TPA: TIGR01212 family radical SAM protein [Bacilli bacterium]|nr:TIGR01212 family radical SAM protein [Bacilli bacterium]